MYIHIYIYTYLYIYIHLICLYPTICLPVSTLYIHIYSICESLSLSHTRAGFFLVLLTRWPVHSLLLVSMRCSVLQFIAVSSSCAHAVCTCTCRVHAYVRMQCARVRALSHQSSTMTEGGNMCAWVCKLFLNKSQDNRGYGVASISRLLKIIGLFCRISSLL